MKIKGVTGREYEAWDPERAKAVNEPSKAKEVQDLLEGLASKVYELERERKRFQQALAHITSLVTEYGLCRPEIQLARMDLPEATERYADNRNWDEKNMGVIAKSVLAEMREKGELP